MMQRPYRKLPAAHLRESLDKAQANLDSLATILQGPLGAVERRAMKAERDAVLRSIASMRAEMRIRKCTPAEPHVTDHALIRFLDRALSYDIEDLRAMILTPDVKAAIKAGMCHIPLREHGVILAVSDGAVTTVLSASE